MITVGDLMTPDPVTLAPKDTLRFAAGVLTSIGAGGAPVLEADRLVGVVSMTDILDFAANHARATPPELGREPRPEAEPADTSASMAVPEGPEWDVLDEHTVEEVMSMRIMALSPAAGVREAAKLMESQGIHRVLIMEEAELLGVLTAWDLVRAVARGDLVVPT